MTAMNLHGNPDGQTQRLIDKIFRVADSSARTPEDVFEVMEELRNVFHKMEQRKAGHPRKLFRVLSIDGGGMRGIVAGCVLEKLEEKLGRPLAECFDLIVGTSTGGIFALGLTRPDPANPGKPLHTATQVKQLYFDQAQTIFPQSYFTKVRQLYGARYDRKGIDSALFKLLGDARLYEALTSIVVPAYDIDKSEAVFMKYMKGNAPSAKHPDYTMLDVARGTSAAPIVFSPAEVFSIPNEFTNGTPMRHGFIDGGIFANNPSTVALFEAYKRMPKDSDLLLVSVGTGHETLHYNFEDASGWGAIHWALPLLEMMMKGQSDAAIYQARHVLGRDRYVRISRPIDFGIPEEDRPNISLDDASPENLVKLQKLGERMTREYGEVIERVANVIRDDMAQRAKPPCGINVPPAPVPPPANDDDDDANRMFGKKARIAVPFPAPGLRPVI